MNVHIAALEDEALTIARGQYATLRHELDTRMKAIGKLAETVRGIVHRLHADLQEAAVDDVHARVEEAKSALDAMTGLSLEVIEIAAKRAELKAIAWGQA